MSSFSLKFIKNQKKIFKFQAGMGLIEVLVSLLLLGIVVLGYAGLELFGLNAITNTHYRERALFVAVEARERISLNPLGQSLYLETAFWSIESSSKVSDSPCKALSSPIDSVCDFAERARLDVENIQLLLSETLPQSQLLIQPCAGDEPLDFCVSIAWHGLNPLDCKNPDSDSANNYDCVQVPIRVI